jgi:hypothetical protein
MKRVTWTIDLDEDTIEAAATVALAIMRDHESTATVFDITDEQGKTVRVDMRRAGKLTPLLRCDNCGRRFTGTEALERVFPDIPDLVNRLDAGGTVPEGECPLCGALVYRERGRVRVGILLDGGLVKAVFADTAGVDAAVLDTELMETEDEPTLTVRAMGETFVGVPQRQTPEIDAGLVGMLFEGVTRIEAAQRKEGKA